MSGPRLSIIPAGAVTDRSLKRGDLQVLCLLGRHTDRLGWCVRSQVKMAVELGCARASVQRSLDRLVAGGWVEMKGRGADTAQPNASYAYRVRLDQDEVAAYAENALQGGGCPPVGTPPASVDNPTFPQGGVPNGLGTGVPNGLGTGCPGRNGHHNDSSERLTTERQESIGDKIGEEQGQPSRDCRTKPVHGAKGRGMVWLDHGTAEWQSYADDYFEKRGVKKKPEKRVGGHGNWFVLMGEPELQERGK